MAVRGDEGWEDRGPQTHGGWAPGGCPTDGPAWLGETPIVSDARDGTRKLYRGEVVIPGSAGWQITQPGVVHDVVIRLGSCPDRSRVVAWSYHGLGPGDITHGRCVGPREAGVAPTVLSCPPHAPHAACSPGPIVALRRRWLVHDAVLGERPVDRAVVRLRWPDDLAGEALEVPWDPERAPQRPRDDQPTRGAEPPPRRGPADGTDGDKSRRPVDLRRPIPSLSALQDGIGKSRDTLPRYHKNQGARASPAGGRRRCTQRSLRSASSPSPTSRSFAASMTSSVWRRSSIRTFPSTAWRRFRTRSA